MGMESAHDDGEFNELGDANITDSELIYHVKNALKSVPLGDVDSYNDLVNILNRTGRLSLDEVAMLVTSLKALSGAVPFIDINHHESLLFAIFQMNMWNHGPEVLDALMELVISLAGSNGHVLDLCLEMLLSSFMPPKWFVPILKQPHGFSRRHHVVSRVHSTFKHIAILVPFAPMNLKNIIPRIKLDVSRAEFKEQIVIYVENILRLESGPFGDVVRVAVLEAVVQLLVEMDLVIDWKDILQDDSSKGIFQMELEDFDSVADEGEEDEGLLSRESVIRKSLEKNLVADIIDSLMVLTFEHLQSCEGEQLEKVIETIFSSFQESVLPIDKSKFTQFLMFYACSLDPQNCGVRFPVMLADYFVCCTYSAENRMISVAYLASYLARAKFISAELILTMLKRLVDWCTEHCQSQRGDINPTGHRLYYSACQAIMYVLCFRMRSILDVPHLRSRLDLMPIESILKHKLNPLKVCLPCIVEEFLRQAKAARLFTVSKTFVFNDLRELESSSDFGGEKRLDMFFPFDPCLLKNCDRLIHPYYVYWSMIRKVDDEAEYNSDEEEDDFDGFGRSHTRDDMANSFEEFGIDNNDEFDCSLEKMSITPKNHRFAKGVQALRQQMPSRIRPSMSPESF